jgi:hypothetical protein
VKEVRFAGGSGVERGLLVTVLPDEDLASKSPVYLQVEIVLKFEGDATKKFGVKFVESNSYVLSILFVKLADAFT